MVGGGPAGIITAATTKSVYPDKRVKLIKDVGDGVIPCAIPYMMRTLAAPEQNAMSTAALEDKGIEVVVDRVTALLPDDNAIELESGGRVGYERLVLATGSTPVAPPIPGIGTPGVFVIDKSLSAMTVLRERVAQAKRVAILGGGFIGAEFADELGRDGGAEVHVIEMQPKLLQTAFDDEYCDEIGGELERAGIHLHLGVRATDIDGEDHVESVTLDDGRRLPVDLVVIGVGGKPNNSLAKDAGLLITDGGGIWVDSYMRTANPNIFAVGDCALKRDFFTRREVPVQLASTATAEARIAGTNIYGIRVLRQIQGTIAAFSTKIGETAFASAGMTCKACVQEGLRVVTGEAAAPDRHPGMLPGAAPMRVKLVFSNTGGALLGGQISGGLSVGELINAVALGIQMKLNVRELDMMQIATHPLLSSAPTVHPLINAAHAALAKMRA